MSRPSETHDPLFDLTGRVAVVTGGSRGIGLAIARAFADRGAKVVVASRKADACEAAAAEIRQAGNEAIGVATHMGDLDALAGLVTTTVGTFGALDIVVNNAANALAVPIGEVTPEAYAKSFDVNVRGPLFLFKEALPHLRASDHAAVVNVISVGAFMFTPGQGLYGAGKNALLHLTRSMAAEHAADGIRVNALAPGTVDTDMVRNTGPEMTEAMGTLSFQRRLAEPDEMVGPALLLVSDAGSYITGQCITADGGYVPPR